MKRWIAGRHGLCAGLMVVLLLGAAACPSRAGPALVMDPASGDVLYADNADHPWFPASLTKIMTAYLTFEAVKAGRLKWDGDLPLSENARAQPATRIGLRGGIKITVEQGVRGLIFRSANDFAMALAEAIGGSEQGFAEMMNATARRLGMTKSHFTNPHGLPDAGQISSARDMALLTAALIRDFPDRLEMFSSQHGPIGKGTFHNQNDLLRTLPGADGMKTGFTCASGYNVVASATRDGRRLIAVLLGELTRTRRSQKATTLLEYGFALKGWQRHLEPINLAELPVDKAEQATADLSRRTRTWKCGNSSREPGDGPDAARPAKAGKKAVAKAKRK